MNFQNVSSFKDIVLIPDTLYVLDFDDTIGYYEGIHKEWWSERFQHYYDNHGCIIKAERLALNDWTEHVKYIDPIPVDKEGFRNIIDYCIHSGGHSHVMILTARNIELTDETRFHLNTISLEKDLDIVFCSGKHKGYKLQEYLMKHKKKYKNLIFIDDLHKNLLDVQEIYKNAICYHMVI